VLVFPAIMHIAVTKSVMPNDGVPLPFVSYGGTGMLFRFVAIGILCRIHCESSMDVKRQDSYPRAGRRGWR
jgi:cell division protein FtsW